MISHTCFVENVTNSDIVIFFFCFEIISIFKIFFQKIVILVIDVIIIFVIIHVVVVLLSGMVAILVSSISLLLGILLSGRCSDCEPIYAKDDEDDQDDGDGCALP